MEMQHVEWNEHGQSYYVDPETAEMSWQLPDEFAWVATTVDNLKKNLLRHAHAEMKERRERTCASRTPAFCARQTSFIQARAIVRESFLVKNFQQRFLALKMIIDTSDACLRLLFQSGNGKSADTTREIKLGGRFHKPATA